MSTLMEERLSPLFRLAIKAGAPDAVALHLRRGEPPNGRDSSGLTPLMIAAMSGRVDVCGALLQGGADRARVNPVGKTASDLAREHGHDALGKFLFPVPIHEATQSGEQVPSGHGFGAALPSPQVLSEKETVTVESCPVPASNHIKRPLSESNPADVTSGQRDDAMPPSDKKSEPDCAISTGADAESVPGALVVQHVRAGTPAPAEEPLGEMYGWVVESKGEIPVHDPSCAHAAVETQHAISVHRRTSNEFDWSDVEFDLPDPPPMSSPMPHAEIAQVARLVACGLKNGRVSIEDIEFAVETDCGMHGARARTVIERVLGELGVLVDGDSFAMDHGYVDEGDEAVNEIVAMLAADIREPSDLPETYNGEVRKYDLINREDEERLGRRMDSALAMLAKSLVSLPVPAWDLVFSSPRIPVPAPVHDEVPESEDDETERACLLAAHEIESDVGTQGGVFRIYVTGVRGGSPECGRDAPVPRPDGPTLTSLLAAACELDDAAARGIRAAIKAYESARDQLVTANLRLVYSNANFYRNAGLPLEDLIQCGNIGLMRAAERFDFRRGFKFSTFATAWIRQGISRGVADTARTIRLPVHILERLNQIERTRRELEHRVAKPMTASEIAMRLSWTENEVKRLLRGDVRAFSLEECGTAGLPDTPDPLTIADPSADPSQAASDRGLSLLIARLVQDFSHKEQAVLVCRFGLDGTDYKTLEEVGQQFNVTRERIRQIEAKIIQKLRHRSRSDALLPYAFSTLMSEN